MPFHVVKSKRKKDAFDVENADTHEVKNDEPYATETDAAAYSRALNVHSEDKSISAIKLMDMAEMGPANYARQEGWDISSAAAAMQQISGLVQSEADEPADMRRIAAILRGLLEFIQSEIAEMESASQENVEEQGEGMSKSLNLSYVKSLGIAKLPDFLAAKYIGRDEIKHYAFLWGGPNIADVEAEYFTRKSNFWDAQLGKTPRPLTWDHAQDETFKAEPVIGKSVDWGDDDTGRWVVSKLERAHKYRKAIDALIEKGILGASSDSAPQYVERVKTGKATWLKTWPWFATALTETPAEPRMIGSLEFLKSIGVQIPNVPAAVVRATNDRRMKLLRLIYLNED